MVSAGNTGARMAISKLILRMASDLDRPAIVASWPTLKGVTAVLDVGANVASDASFNFTAARDIEEGEELTIRYLDFSRART